MVIVSHFESFENNLFEFRFLDISRNVFLRLNPHRKVKVFLHDYDTLFSRSLLLSIEQNPKPVDNLKLLVIYFLSAWG